MKRSAKSNQSKTAAERARPAGTLDAKAHTELFANAMKLFTKGDYRAAKERYDQASRGPVLSVNESALMYSRMCAKRLEQQRPELKTAEDHYNYAIGLMNLHRADDAVPHLKKAIELGDSGHIRYAMALACGLNGDVPGAAAHLRRAIEMDPGIRSLARQDPDCQPLLRDAGIRALVTADKGGD